MEIEIVDDGGDCRTLNVRFPSSAGSHRQKKKTASRSK
jgi:hypothetical protein